MAVPDLGPNYPQSVASLILPLFWFVWPFSLVGARPEARDDPAVYALAIIFLIAASTMFCMAAFLNLYGSGTSEVVLKLAALCSLLYFVFFSVIFSNITKPQSPVVRPFLSFFAIFFTLVFAVWLKNETRLAALRRIY